jgi:carboxylate-amine ligase
MKEHTFTLGIEEEFAIVDPETRELRSHIQEILEYGKVILKEQIKPEMHQSVVELGTEICQSIVDARAHVIELRSRLAELAARSELKIASSSARIHFRTGAINITQAALSRNRQGHAQLARANLIFGLHVHVGIPDREVAIHVMNQARYFLPHIYALSVNSPFWVGRTRA